MKARIKDHYDTMIENPHEDAVMKSLHSNALMMFAVLSLCFGINTVSAQTAPPPTFGQETKGKPAIPEIKKTNSKEKAMESLSAKEQADASDSLTTNLLGKATIRESRRESGQVYRIELEHSSGSKQYIEENDSDGELDSDGMDFDDTPNLPKWKLGSW